MFWPGRRLKLILAVVAVDGQQLDLKDQSRVCYLIFATNDNKVNLHFTKKKKTSCSIATKILHLRGMLAPAPRSPYLIDMMIT